ncbi:hypothetical protein D3C72_2328470 [compost metagenome]
MGVEVAEDSASALTAWLVALALLVLALAGAIGLLLWRYGKPVARTPVRREPAHEARGS